MHSQKQSKTYKWTRFQNIKDTYTFLFLIILNNWRKKYIDTAPQFCLMSEFASTQVKNQLNMIQPDQFSFYLED